MSDSNRVTLEVGAADDASEIFLIDGGFKLVDRAVGSAAFQVTPGLYKVKNRAGRALTEQIVVARPGMAKVVLPPLPLNSAMPLRDSAWHNPAHADAARQAAVTPDLAPGSGSAIIVVARRWAPLDAATSGTPLPNPALGLSLRDLAGTELVDLSARNPANGGAQPCVTLHVAVNPGAYLLSQLLPDGRRVVQTLIAAPGWQTQVYLLAGATPEDGGRADLVNAAITLRRPGQPFDPADAALRREEVVRGALQFGRRILSPRVRSVITDAGTSPMLALFGAHLLIRELARGDERTPATDDNLTPLRQILGNLRTALGSTPDLEAVAIAAGQPNPAYTFEVPPMLRSAWPLVLDASVHHADVIVAGSLTAGVAERVWGEGVWLQWLGADAVDQAGRRAAWQATAASILASITPAEVGPVPSIFGARTTSLPPPPSAPGFSFKHLAGGVFKKGKALFTPRSHAPFPEWHPPAAAEPTASAASAPPSVDLRAIRANLTDQQRKELVARLGVPMSSINAWIEGKRE